MWLVKDSFKIVQISYQFYGDKYSHLRLYGEYPRLFVYGRFTVLWEQLTVTVGDRRCVLRTHETG